MRYNYWSCSKLAKWILADKPSSATAEEWNIWTKTSRTSYPFRHWLVETAFNNVQDFLCWPIDKWHDCVSYFNNRYVSKTHALTANKKNISRGKWCDVDGRFLPCMFDTLVDFVEIETAWMSIVFDEASAKKYGYKWWHRLPLVQWRNKQAGIDHLVWQTELVFDEDSGVYPDSIEYYGKPTPQAIAALEVLNLYKWWTEEYPNRTDVHDASGWTEYCSKKHNDSPNHLLSSLSNESDEEKKLAHTILDECHRLELARENEDTEMMIRLIKVRGKLWT